jgi:uncharacterized integral membrane protein
VKLPERKSEQGIYLQIAVAALIVIFLVAFVVSNSRRAKISFVAFDTQAPLIVVMVLCILLGVIGGVAIGGVAERRRAARSSYKDGTGNGPTAAS